MSGPKVPGTTDPIAPDTSEIVVRRAGSADVAAVTALMRAQNAYHVDLVPHIVKRVDRATTEAWCAERLAASDCAIFLAWSGAGGAEEEEAVGLVMLHVKEIADQAGLHGIRLGFVDELFVQEAARRRGVARALVAAARDCARALRCNALSLNVWAENEAAIAAYAALGFAPVFHRMALTLDAEE